jgi:hypothetical protein
LKKVSTASGTIIGESIRLGAALDGIPLTVWRIRSGGSERLSPQQEAAGMPSRWTLIEFEIDDHDAPALARALANVLEDSGRYVDFHSRDEKFVVFAGRVFRYRRGDERRRAEAEAYARHEACRTRSSTGPSDPCSRVPLLVTVLGGGPNRAHLRGDRTDGITD